MSETQETNTPANETEKPKKKKGKLLLLIVLVLLLAGGGGAGYYFWAKAKAAAEAEAETAESNDEEAPEEEKKPKSKKRAHKEEDEEEETSAKGNKLKEHLPEDEEVKHVVELSPFLVNLADSESPRYLRMTVNLGIGGEGGEEEKPNPLFLTRVKNAMLAVLAGKKSEEILSVEGKARLRKELLKAAQAASEEPHVEAVYITDFIVQL